MILGVSLGLLGTIALARPVAATQPIRIAVAPFAGEQRSMPIARALTGRLEQRGLDRVIAPGDFVASTSFEPRAEDVRRWAYNSAVDAIVVGRVSSVGQKDDAGGRRVETVVRSGHSGAELGRHDVLVPRGGDVDGSVERLAVAILGDLGYVDAASTGTTPPVSAPAKSSGGGAPVEGSSGEAKSGGALGLDLSGSGFESDAPIEIKSDQAEIFDQKGGRKLVFQKDVWVRQANVTLQSDRLEATYRKGESEPSELIATGHVVIVQDDRRAKCDRAVYRREASRLTCSGHAELVQGCDIVRGRSIVFDLAGDQARVEGAASIVIHPEEEDVTDCSIERDPS